MNNDSIDVIPEGIYCHGVKENKRYVCPYWSLSKDHPEQENGYCAYLKRGDWNVTWLSLLWDQVKECGINDAFIDD